jgi:hypothetical protein
MTEHKTKRVFKVYIAVSSSAILLAASPAITTLFRVAFLLASVRSGILLALYMFRNLFLSTFKMRVCSTAVEQPLDKEVLQVWQ